MESAFFQKGRSVTAMGLFQRLWSKAIGTSEYVEAEWLAFRDLLEVLEVRAPPDVAQVEQLTRIADALEAMGGAPWIKR